MTAILIRIAGSFGVPDRLRKVVGGVIGAVALLAVLAALWGAYTVWLGWHDRHVITLDRAVSNAEVRNVQIGTERQAGADKATRDDQFATNQAEIKETTDAAADNGNSPLDELYRRLR
ncbi:MAG TPA: hypothetical protein VF638_00945 [Sphingomonas sp.]|jgi:hypothetical protein